MIIVGLENCDTCKVFKQRHPDIPYVEIPRKMSGNKDDKVRQIKLMTGKYKLNVFPLIIEDDLSDFISIHIVDRDFAKDHPKLF